MDGRVDERGEDIRKILSEDGRGIAVPLIPSWSGDEGPAMMAERTNEDPGKGERTALTMLVGGNMSLEE